MFLYISAQEWPELRERGVHRGMREMKPVQDSIVHVMHYLLIYPIIF